MFKVIGRGVRFLGDDKATGIEVTAEVRTDAGVVVDKITIIGVDLADVRAQIATLLARRVLAETDAVLSRQVVNQELGSV